MNDDMIDGDMVDVALDAVAVNIQDAIDSLAAAGEQLRVSAAELPTKPHTPAQATRRYILLGAVSAAQRALKDAQTGRLELTEAEHVEHGRGLG